MQSTAFYYYHLERVSRSFSFCIMQLHSPAKEWVALSYLLCRIVDILEDAQWPEPIAQYHAFECLQQFFRSPPTVKDHQAWLEGFPSTLPSQERQLLMALPLLLEDSQELPPPLQQSLSHTLFTMIDGMRYFIHHYSQQSILVLPSLLTTNQYCFFVAGIVGELLTRIFTFLIPGFLLTEAVLIQSFHFGLFLQKINILKDKAEDEANGRYFIPSREEVRYSLIVNAQEALRYIDAIPIIQGRHYRLFCAWSLFIGLATLRWIDKSMLHNEYYKIKPRETHYLINQLEQFIDDNQALEALFNRYTPALGIFPTPCHLTCQGPWLNALYPYPFSKKDSHALGIGESAA